MLIDAFFAAGDLARLKEIARILIRHGFGDLVQRTGLARWLERAGAILRWEALRRMERRAPAERLRLALEELGPIFVKFGQLLASRPDWIGPEWAAELGRLHEGVGPLAWQEIAAQLREDLGAEPERVFAELEQTPLAAGSIAQVHRARLKSGEEVVLKIRRPQIEAKASADLRLLRRLADLAARELPEVARYQPVRVLKEFRRSLRAELDLTLEARHMQVLSAALADEPQLVIPRVFATFTRPRLLVLEYLPGLSAAEWIAGARPPSFDSKALARLGAKLIIRMVFSVGLYHADPHPGNVLFLDGGRIGLLDFGMVGRLAPPRRREFVLLLSTVLKRDEEAAAKLLLSWAGAERVELEPLREDLRAFLERYHGLELGDLDVAGLLRDISEVVRENHLQLPSDVAMLIKLFLTLEGLGSELDPDFDLSSSLAPEVEALLTQELSPRLLLRQNLRSLRALLLALPADLEALVTGLHRGRFRLDLDLERLDAFGRQIERSSNRITVGLIASALIVGTSIAMTVAEGPRVWGLPALGLIGFLSSGLIGALLLWSISRSRTR